MSIPVAIASAVVVMVSAFFALRTFWRWVFPVRIRASWFMSFEDGGADEIRADVINRSGESQYITRCRALSAHSFRRILTTHIRHPFIRPRLYPAVWFGMQTYELLGSTERRIEPYEIAHLAHKLNINFPLTRFLTPMFQIEVALSSGRTVRSKRLAVPERWKFQSINAPAAHATPNNSLQRTSLTGRR